MTGNVTINDIDGNFETKKHVSINDSGFMFNIIVDGKVDIGDDNTISANITATGDIKDRKTRYF